MKQRSRRAPAVVQDRTAGVSRPKPELCPPPAGQARSAGTSLIFADPDAVRQRDTADPNDIGKTARAWDWCEWLRISLVAAALLAAGLVLGAKTVAQRAHAQSIHPPYAPAPPLPRAILPAAAQSQGEPTTLGAIHYFSDEHSTTVIVELQNLVFFEAHRLTGPDRIYFDLQGTRMPPGLDGKLIQVEVKETFVKKIRVAERGPGITRLVLQTTPGCDYSAMIASAPYRLIVRLHAPEQ